jgi:putative exosortase-associated protein (TIGR04073 family)
MARIPVARTLTALAIVALALAWSGAADLQAKEGPLYAYSKTAKMTRKFWRGIGNTFFFWGEIPKSIFHKAYDADPFTGIVYGLGEGLEKGIQRLGVGLWETATFYAPCGREYKPYIEPEFVLMDVVDE